MSPSLIPTKTLSLVHITHSLHDNMFVCPPEGPVNCEKYMIVKNLGKTGRIALVSVRSASEPAEGNCGRSRDLDWIEPASPEDEYLLAVKLPFDGIAMEPGDYVADFAWSKGLESGFGSIGFSNWDCTLVRPGFTICAAGDEYFIYRATQAAIKIFGRRTGKSLSWLFAPPGERLLDMASGRTFLFALTDHGYLHMYSKKDFSRLTYKLTDSMLTDGRLNLAGNRANTLLCFFEKKGEKKCYRIFFEPETGNIFDISKTKLFRDDEHITVSNGAGVFVVERNNPHQYKFDHEGQTTWKDFPDGKAKDAASSKVWLLEGFPELGIPPELFLSWNLQFTALMPGNDGRFLEKTLEGNHFHVSSENIRMIGNGRYDFCHTFQVFAFHQTYPLNENMLTMSIADDFPATGRSSSAVFQGNLTYAVGDSKGRIFLYKAGSKPANIYQVHKSFSCREVTRRSAVESADVCCLQFSPCGNYLFSGGHDTFVNCNKIIHNENGPELIAGIWSLNGNGNAQEMLYNTKLNMLVISFPYQVSLVDPQTGKELKTWQSFDEVLDPIAVNYKTDQLCVGDWGGNIHILDCATLHKKKSFKITDSSIFNIISIHETAVLIITENGNAHIVDLEGEKIIFTFDYYLVCGNRRSSDVLIADQAGRPSLVWQMKDSPRAGISIRPVWIFPWKNMVFSDGGRVFLHPLLHNLSSLRPLLS